MVSSVEYSTRAGFFSVTDAPWGEVQSRDSQLLHWAQESETGVSQKSRFPVKAGIFPLFKAVAAFEASSINPARS